MLHLVEPAAAARRPKEIGIRRQQPRHRMRVAAHQGAVDEQKVGGHAVTSSLTTENLARVIRPKLVDSATSAASRPVAIRMRPMRGTTWRASNVYHWPERYASNQPEKSIGIGSGGIPMSPM